MTDVVTQSAPAAAPAVPHLGLAEFRDPLRIAPLIRPHSWWHQDEITINMTTARVRLRSQLPATTVWAYEGQFPGPHHRGPSRSTGQFMYHCHTLDHEDEDEGMMRPFVVHPPEVARCHVHPGGGHGEH